MKEPGEITMPADFKYKKVHEKGRPRHEKYSEFMCRHPSMKNSRRAKLFMPFDALKGFDESIRAAEAESVKRAFQSSSDKR